MYLQVCELKQKEKRTEKMLLCRSIDELITWFAKCLISIVVLYYTKFTVFFTN